MYISQIEAGMKMIELNEVSTSITSKHGLMFASHFRRKFGTRLQLRKRDFVQPNAEFDYTMKKLYDNLRKHAT